MQNPILNSRTNSKQGFTLVELLVYIVLASIVTTLASIFWFNSAVFSIHSKAKMKSSADATQIMVYLEEDLARIGTNLDIEDEEVNLDPFVYVNTDPANLDLSSFIITDGGDKDGITYYSVIYDENGFFSHKEEVTFSVVNDSLYREVQKFDEFNAPDGAAQKTLWADGVEKFNIDVGVATEIIEKGTKEELKSSDFILGGTTPPILTESANWVTLNGFVAKSDSKWTWAKEGVLLSFELKKGKTYRFTFTTVADDDLVSTHNPITDSLYVVFQKDVGTEIDNVIPYVFYPGQSGEETVRQYDFSPGEDVSKGHIMFKSEFENIVGVPSLLLSDFKFEEVGQAEYAWYEANDEDMLDYKQFAKALQINLKINHERNNQENATSILKIVGIPNNAVAND